MLKSDTILIYMSFLSHYYSILTSRVSRKIIFAVAFLAVLTTRLIHVTSIPAVVSHDELFYPTQAAALSISGSDTTGTWNPLSFSSSHPLFAELPGLVMTWPFFIFPQNHLLAFKVSSAVIGTCLLFVLANIVKAVTGSKRMEKLVLLVGLFNPWLFQFSRMGFDSLYSLFFYFLGILIVLRYKSYKILWSLPIFLIGFFQYQGLKVVFVPLILTTVIYSIKLHNLNFDLKNFVVSCKKITPHVIVIFFSIALFLFYLLKNYVSPDQARVKNDLVFSDKVKISTIVNTDRQQSLNSPLISIFVNKYSASSKLIFQQYLESFSPVNIFATGEPLRNPFSVWKWGMFLPIDLILIVFGWWWLLNNSKNRRFGLYLLTLLLIAPIPSAINAKGSWIMFRSSLMIPVLIIVAAFGFNYILRKLSRKLALLFFFVYIISILFFVFEYFYKYPIYGTQGEYLSERVLGSYASRARVGEVIVLAREPRFVYESVLLFSNLITKNNLDQIKDSINSGVYQINNLTVTSNCFDPSIVGDNKTYIVHSTIPNCAQMLNSTDSPDSPTTMKSSIVSLIDAGAVYFVYNDQLCDGYLRPRYSHVTNNVFEIEKLNDRDFCENFISTTM
jgi:hypothetical protein